MIHSCLVCVCVYHLNRCKTSYWFSLICRGWMHGLAVIHQRRHCLSMVIWQRDAFVTYLLFFGHSKGPSLEPQQQCYTICCTVVAIWNQFYDLHASEPSSDLRRNHIADSIMVFYLFSPKSCRRRTVGPFGKQSPKHYCGFSTCWLKLYGIWLWLRLTILDALHRSREVPHMAPLLI